MPFDFDAETGVIRDKITGERCIILTQARMQDIFSRLSGIFQSGAKVISFEAGKAAGKHFVEETPDVTKTDNQLFLKTITQRFTDAGLGKIEIVEFVPEKAEVTFRIWNNFFAGLGSEQPMYRSCIEGFVSGTYEQIMSITPKIKKTKCITNGDPYCEWHMTPK
jgi:predicted hydrocarbon binding protein